MKFQYLKPRSILTNLAIGAAFVGFTQFAVVSCTRDNQMNTAVQKGDTTTPAVGQVGAPGEARPAETMTKDSADASQDLKAAQTPAPTPAKP